MFLKSTGTLLKHKVYKGKTIKNCLIPASNETRKKQKSSRTKYKLLHDNDYAHTHPNIVNYLTEQGIELIPHPPYSRYIAPCNF